MVAADIKTRERFERDCSQVFRRYAMKPMKRLMPRVRSFSGI